MRAWEAVLAYVIGPGVVGIGTWLAARIAASGAKYAADKTTDADKGAAVLSGYHQLVEDLRTEVTRISQEVLSLRARVDALAAQERRDKSVIKSLLAYVRLLIDEIRRVGGDVPDPPAGVDFDDPEPLPPPPWRN